VVEDGEAAPTEQDYAVFSDLSQRLDRELQALDKLLGTELPRLNAKLAAAQLPAIERKPEPAVEQGTATADESEDKNNGE
jgi:hypothetical protein